MENESSITQTRKIRPLIIYTFVFFSGLANLATEIIGPRLIASLFGNTTVIWATIISVTLLGISLGYYLAGRVAYQRAFHVLSAVLLLNAFWLLGMVCCR